MADAVALRRWTRACAEDPYDHDARVRLAAILFRVHGEDQPFGTIERGRMLLGLIRQSCPTAELEEAYFANLDALLARRAELPAPGRLVLGLGTGRCGSTSLASLLSAIAGSCCTHENPPLVYWQPLEAQARFHLRRFARLLRSFALVFDAAHWWLTLADRVLAQFPDALLIALTRDEEACARSFLAVKGIYNHWLTPGHPRAPSSWDPTYPSYEPAAEAGDPLAQKRLLIGRYIAEYRERLAELQQRHPANYMGMRTEMLSDCEAQSALFRRLGLAGRGADIRLNVGGFADGTQPKFCF